MLPNFKNREDNSDFDDFWTVVIRRGLAITSKIFASSKNVRVAEKTLGSCCVAGSIASCFLPGEFVILCLHHKWAAVILFLHQILHFHTLETLLTLVTACRPFCSRSFCIEASAPTRRSAGAPARRRAGAPARRRAGASEIGAEFGTEIGAEIGAENLFHKP